MLKAGFKKYILNFKFRAGTSRGTMLTRKTWFVFVYDENNSGQMGIGECAPLDELSRDPLDNFESVLQETCARINDDDRDNIERLEKYPAIRFGIETALQDYNTGAVHIPYPSDFTRGTSGININGLIWMDAKTEMIKSIRAKLDEGYRCLKLKIGALNFNDELDIIKWVRGHFNSSDLEIRLDANGSFSPKAACEKLEKLSVYNIHSIEQPIKQGQIEEMGSLCKKSPIPIALDEELIGSFNDAEKHSLVSEIRPAYIILKPSLLGGFAESKKWIDIADKLSVNWWITSALESNIGLNAIAQWAYTLDSKMVQGMGTGGLYFNNIPSPLYIRNSKLFYKPVASWDISEILT